MRLSPCDLESLPSKGIIAAFRYAQHLRHPFDRKHRFLCLHDCQPLPGVVEERATAFFKMSPLLLGDLKFAPQALVFLFKRLLVSRTRKRLLRTGGKRPATASGRTLVQAKVSFHLPVRHPIRIWQTNGFTLKRSVILCPCSDDARFFIGTPPNRTYSALYAEDYVRKGVGEGVPFVGDRRGREDPCV